MNQSKSLKINAKWWRHSSYQLFAGSIVPQDDSVLIEYDPWAEFVKNEGKYRNVAQPYVEFLELSRHLANLQARGVTPTPRPDVPPGDGVLPIGLPVGPRSEADELILAWCNKHGLLGILPVEYSMIRTVTHAHHRTRGRWISLPVFTKEQKEGFIAHAVQLGDTAPSGALDSEPPTVLHYRGWQIPPGEDGGPATVRHSWWNMGGVPQVDTGLDTVLPFFPQGFWRGAGSLSLLPCPNTGMFFEMYGEPLRDFCDAAWNFADAVDLVSKGVRKGDKPEREKRDFRTGLLYTETLAQAVGEVFLPDLGGRVVQERWSAGLLASYALMFLEDVCADRRALRCERCSTVFVSDEHKAKYCSPRCRSAVQMKRFYENKKSRKGQPA